jgi:hypothetical protein
MLVMPLAPFLAQEKSLTRVSWYYYFIIINYYYYYYKDLAICGKKVSCLGGVG